MGYLAYILPIEGGLPGNALPGGPPARPDQGLPGSQPGIDNSLPGMGRPVDPGFGGGRPNLPGQSLPPGLRPDQGLPGSPGHPSNRPPGSGGGRPDQGLPISPGHPSQGLPSGQPTPHGVAAATAPPTAVDAEKGAWVLVALGDGVVVWAWAQFPNTEGGGGGSGSVDNTLPAQPPQGQTKPLPTPTPHKK